MNQNKSVRFNFIMNFILTISNFIFPLITFPYASRILQANGVGIVTFATSIITYFSMLGMLGIPTYGIRACAKVREDKERLTKTVQEIMIINTVVTVIALIGLFICVLTIDKLEQEKFLYLIMSSTLIFNVIGVDWLYKGLEMYSYITYRSIIFKFLSLILLFLFVKDSGDYVIYGAISVFAGVGSNLMNFYNLRKIITFKPENSLEFGIHIKPIMTFFLLTVSSTIYLNVDTTLLGFIKGDDAVGYYSAAVKVKQILVSVVTSLGAVLLPRLSYYHEQGQTAEFARLTQKALNFVFLLSIPLVVYFTISANESILFLSGSSFLPAVLPMQLIMPTVLFIGLSNLFGMQILVPTNREHLVVVSTVVGAVVDLLINLVAIPLFGASGAAFAGSVAEFAVALVQLLFLSSLVIPMLRKVSLVRITLAVLVASCLTILTKGILPTGVFVTLVITSILFFACYGLVLLLLKEEFTTETVKSVLVRFNRKA